MKQVEQLFLGQCARGGFPGGQLVVQRGSERLLDVATGIASGLREGEGEPVAVTPETRFQVMSASKAVLARCVALLEMRGKLELNAPVSRYVPEFCAPQVTLFDVLTHRSGVTLPYLSAHPELWSDWRNVVSALREEPPAFRRGTLAYQPMAFGWILSEVLQQVTAETVPDFCKRELDPALEWLTAGETAKTYWLGSPKYLLNGSNLALGFEATNNGISARSAFVPGAGMYTTARALAAFYASLVRDRSPGFQKYTQKQTGGIDQVTGAYLVLGLGFALGWRWPHLYGYWGSQHCFGHAGGFSVVAYADRETEVGVAMVSNANRSVMDLVKRCAPIASAIRRALRTRTAAWGCPA
ncbi:MAG TPA: serine hydrolase domain-containing protein [Polyangiaceae bacterium]|nr:serine hydrolase domain-containing protein [Polyangiaceae bacterium]